jgi:putative aldouronate transport system substrate-binding protein
MNKSTKWLATGVTVALSTGLLAGCGGNAEDPKTSASETPTASMAPTVEPPLKISWKNQNDGPHDPESPITKEIEKKFNVKLDYVYLDRAKETELLNLKIASGEIPDVMSLQPNTFSSYAQQGALAEIPEDMIKKFAPKSYAALKSFAGDNIFEFYKVNGKLYGLPQVTPNNDHLVPIWRDDWLKNVGITKVPETLQEAETALYKFVNDDPDKNGKKDTYGLSNKGFEAVYGAFGAALQDESRKLLAWANRSGQIQLSATLPEMKEALKVLNKWYKDGLIDPEFVTGENKGQSWSNAVAFWNGKIGFTVPGVYYHVIHPVDSKTNPNDKGSGNYQNFIKLQPNGTYAPGTPLTGPTGQKGIYRWSANTGASVSFGKDVAKEPKKIEKVLAMWEAYNFDENYYKLAAFGIEGLTYDTNKDTGLPTRKPEVDILKQALYSVGANGPLLGIVNMSMHIKMAMTPNIKDFREKYSNNVKGYENAVWAALPSDGKYMSNIYKKVMEVYAQFITGTLSLDKDWDAFISDLNKSGLHELTQEANDWYKKYYGK